MRDIIKITVASFSIICLMASADFPKNNKVKLVRADSDLMERIPMSEEATDLEIAQKIREEIYKDDSLSIYANNIIIMPENGFVTLKGAVRSQNERSRVEAIAKRVVGDKALYSELRLSR